MIELMKIVEKHNTLITINHSTYFVFLNLSLKFCNNAFYYA